MEWNIYKYAETALGVTCQGARERKRERAGGAALHPGKLHALFHAECELPYIYTIRHSGFTSTLPPEEEGASQVLPLLAYNKSYSRCFKFKAEPNTILWLNNLGHSSVYYVNVK